MDYSNNRFWPQLSTTGFVSSLKVVFLLEESFQWLNAWFFSYWFSFLRACDTERQTKQHHTGASAAPGVLRSPAPLEHQPRSTGTSPHGNPSANVPVVFLFQSLEIISYTLPSPICYLVLILNNWTVALWICIFVFPTGFPRRVGWREQSGCTALQARLQNSQPFVIGFDDSDMIDFVLGELIT